MSLSQLLSGIAWLAKSSTFLIKRVVGIALCCHRGKSRHMLAEATHDRIGRFLVAVVLQSRDSLSCIRTVIIVPLAGAF